MEETHQRRHPLEQCVEDQVAKDTGTNSKPHNLPLHIVTRSRRVAERMSRAKHTRGRQRGADRTGQPCTMGKEGGMRTGRGAPNSWR